MTTSSLWSKALCFALLVGTPLFAPAQNQPEAPRNVIFFHPDGYGLSHWDALRFLVVGPDGRLNWDRMPHLATYKGHMDNLLTGSSHGGATTHAYGVKVHFDSFGLDMHDPITALSGQQKSIMEEALEAGFATALLQTGSLTEPGTAAFVASVQERREFAEVARQVVESGVDIILGGGEGWLLPEGVTGRHGAGQRTDGLNLIERAQALGYTVVYTRDELMALPRNTAKVFGVFAHAHTFHDRTEEALRRAGLPLFVPTAPSIAEMAQVSLELLANNPKAAQRGFLMVAEDEGTDNFGNNSNAVGSLESGRRSDQAIGVFQQFIGRSPRTLLLMAADSSAGSMSVQSGLRLDANVGAIEVNSAADGQWVEVPLDGVDGTATRPFVSAPDRNGVAHPFGIAWASQGDMSGGIVARAQGLNAERLSALGIVDNTDIYRLMYYTLFGRWLD